ncbi:MAG: hypothetical protein ACOX33_02675 [Dethiobacteria bacterium]|jgi:acetylornithine deacetylase
MSLEIIQAAGNHYDIGYTVGRAALGAAPQQRAFTAWSDAGILSTYGGIPSLIFAPGEMAVAHSAGEYIEIKDLLPAALIYALTAARFCGYVK